MNYQEARAYTDMLGAGGIMPGLSRIQALLDYFHHPEKELAVIHVAGTNGKGSVCSFIASVLEEAGYRTGRYISPELENYRDRIMVNGEWISEEDVAQLMTQIKAAAEAVFAETGEMPSAFEAETVMAFLYFVSQKCDFVVLECGMGGSLDATNVIEHPLVSVITPVAMDHMQYLGSDIKEIAENKGGIIKAGRPVVIGAKDPQAIDVLQNLCLLKHAPAHVTQFDRIMVHSVNLFTGISFDYGGISRLRTQMPAVYQTENAAIALDTLMVLRALPDEDYNLPYYLTPAHMLTDSVIYKGISQVKWTGRFEIVRDKPMMIIDGGHNPHGIDALINALRTLHLDRNVTVMMAVFKDKAYAQMLEKLSGISDTIITYAPPGSRGLDSKVLLEEAGARFSHAQAADSQREAYAKALSLTPENGVIVACGSLSTVASLKQLISEPLLQEAVNEQV